MYIVPPLHSINHSFYNNDYDVHTTKSPTLLYFNKLMLKINFNYDDMFHHD